MNKYRKRQFFSRISFLRGRPHHQLNSVKKKLGVATPHSVLDTLKVRYWPNTGFHPEGFYIQGKYNMTPNTLG